MVRFRLDKASPTPLYRQIVDMVLAGISGGALPPGERLPTIRELAVQLEVNPNTIVKAYRQLEMMGMLDSQQGSGVYIKALPVVRSEKADRQAVEALCRDFIGRAQLLNIRLPELIRNLVRMRRELAVAASAKRR